MTGIRLSFLLLALLTACISANAQDRCGTVEHEQNNVRESIQHFEHWISLKKHQHNLEAGRKQATKYKVPVVFHIIHKGEPYGTGVNIPDEQIYSQIKVLNNDYQRRNKDAVKTPGDFLPVAGLMDIEFVLARQDPQGNPTTGINRVQGTQPSWWSFEHVQLKSLSYWPAEDYLNIWVFDFEDFLGLAEYPISDLPGLEGVPDNRETDGIMVKYNCVGSDDDGDFNVQAQYNKGRTLSHEMGHFLGLRHIWGDLVGCEGTDYVDDTPAQYNNSVGCPTHPHSTCSPPIVSMFQNFMDYTDDDCMNLFTKDQIERMTIVIDNSPRRKSLLTSPGLQFPAPINNDLAFGETAPVVQCTHQVTPKVTIKNVGLNNITTAKILLRFGSSLIEEKNLTLSLAPSDSVVVQFNPTTVADDSSVLTFEIVNVNGVADINYVNNIKDLYILINEASDFIPLRQDFEKPFEETWTIVNNERGMNWDTVKTNYGVSIYFNAFNNFVIGDQSWLVSPTLDFSNTSSASMQFDLSYRRGEDTTDELKIMISDNCGVTYQPLSYTLPQAAVSEEGWVPEEEDDWYNDQHIDLSSFAGSEDIRLAFVAKNNTGNNLYLDNIEFFIVSDPIAVGQGYSIFGYDPANMEASKLKIGFNLDERQDVICEIFSLIGTQVYAVMWPDVINQVFDLPLSTIVTGAYVVRLKIGNSYSSKLIFRY